MKKLLLFITLIASLSSFCYANLGRGVIKYTLNEVYLYEEGKGEDSSRRVKRDVDSLEAGHILRTGSNSKTELIFEDGSVARLGGNSLLKAGLFDRELFLEWGALVYHTQNNQQQTLIWVGNVSIEFVNATFVVEVESGVEDEKGTVRHVKRLEKDGEISAEDTFESRMVKVVVIEGEVVVRTRRLGEKVTVEKGEMLETDAEADRLSEPRTIDLKVFVDSSTLIDSPKDPGKPKGEPKPDPDEPGYTPEEKTPHKYGDPDPEEKVPHEYGDPKPEGKTPHEYDDPKAEEKTPKEYPDPDGGEKKPIYGEGYLDDSEGKPEGGYTGGDEKKPIYGEGYIEDSGGKPEGTTTENPNGPGVLGTPVDSPEPVIGEALGLGVLGEPVDAPDSGVGDPADYESAIPSFDLNNPEHDGEPQEPVGYDAPDGLRHAEVIRVAIDSGSVGKPRQIDAPEKDYTTQPPRRWGGSTPERLPLIGQPDPFVINLATTIITNPHISMNGEWYTGALFKNDQSLSDFVFGNTSAADNYFRFSATNSILSPFPWFRFRNLIIEGTPTIENPNGARSLGLYAEESLVLDSMKATITFPGFEQIRLVGEKGVTLINSTILGTPVYDSQIMVYNRGAGNELRLGDQVEIYSNRGITLHSAGDLHMGRVTLAAHGVEVSSLGNTIFRGTDKVQNSAYLNGYGYTHLNVAGMDIAGELVLGGSSRVIVQEGGRVVFRPIDPTETAANNSYSGIKLENIYQSGGNHIFTFFAPVTVDGDVYAFLGDTVDHFLVAYAADNTIPIDLIIDARKSVEGLFHIVSNSTVIGGNLGVEAILSKTNLAVTGNTTASSIVTNDGLFFGETHISGSYLSYNYFVEGVHNPNANLRTKDKFYATDVITGSITTEALTEVSNSVYASGTTTVGALFNVGNELVIEELVNTSGFINAPTIKVNNQMTIADTVNTQKLEILGEADYWDNGMSMGNPLSRYFEVGISLNGDYKINVLESDYVPVALQAGYLIFDKDETDIGNEGIGEVKVRTQMTNMAGDTYEAGRYSGGTFIANSESFIRVANSTISVMGDDAGNKLGGLLELTASDGDILIDNAKLEVGDTTTAGTNAAVRIIATKPNVSGIAIKVTSSSEILAYAQNSEAILRAAQGDIEFDGKINSRNITLLAEGAGAVIRIGDQAQFNMAENLKVGALGDNGALLIGGANSMLINASEQIKLYANTHNGLVRFVGDVTLNSPDTNIAGKTVQIDNGRTVTIPFGTAKVFTDNANFNQAGYGDFSGSINTQPAANAPGF